MPWRFKMATISEQINDAIKESMKSKNKIRLNAMRYVKKLLIENRTSKKPRGEQDVVIAYAKQLKDSLLSYKEGSDQYSQINQEIKYLADYLPEQLGEAEVKALIEGFVAAQDNPNMGTIMRVLSPAIKGKFDGRRANELVKEALA